jgi:predicted CXXCH cytochrome family protein
MIKTFLFYFAFIFVALSLAPAAFSFVEQERDTVAAHRRCENCHLSGNDDDPDDPSYDPRQWASPSPLKKSSFGVEELSSSKLCLSCHDGTLAGDTGSHLGANSKVGIDLTRSHPVSVEYRTDFTSGCRKLTPPAGITPLKLYNRKIECLSCHDIHGQNPAKLRMSKRELCFRCHNV